MFTSQYEGIYIHIFEDNIIIQRKKKCERGKKYPNILYSV